MRSYYDTTVYHVVYEEPPPPPPSRSREGDVSCLDDGEWFVRLVSLDDGI